MRFDGSETALTGARGIREGLPAAAPHMPVCQWGYILCCRLSQEGDGGLCYARLAGVITEVARSICLLMLAMTCYGWHDRHGSTGHVGSAAHG